MLIRPAGTFASRPGRGKRSIPTSARHSLSNSSAMRAGTQGAVHRQAFIYPRGCTAVSGGTRMVPWHKVSRRWGVRRPLPKLQEEPASWRIHGHEGLPTDLFLLSITVPHGGSPCVAPWVRWLVGLLFVEESLFWSKKAALRRDRELANPGAERDDLGQGSGLHESRQEEGGSTLQPWAIARFVVTRVEGMACEKIEGTQLRPEGPPPGLCEEAGQLHRQALAGEGQKRAW